MPRGRPAQLTVPVALRRTGLTLRDFAKRAADEGEIRRTQKQLIVQFKPQDDVAFEHIVANGQKKTRSPFSTHFWREKGEDRLLQHRRELLGDDAPAQLDQLMERREAVHRSVRILANG